MGRIRNKSKYAGKYVVKRRKTKEELELERIKEIENKIYWAKVVTAAIVAYVGRVLLNLVGWANFFWMLAWWFGFPFILTFIILRIPLDREKGWKERIKFDLKTGIGAFFLVYMTVGTICHTMLVYPLWSQYW